MSYYITKYALSMGISVLEDADFEVGDSGMLCPKSHVPFSGRNYFHKEGGEWHRTKKAAITRAEEIRIAKIASLKKQISRLEKLDFNAWGPK